MSQRRVRVRAVVVAMATVCIGFPAAVAGQGGWSPSVGLVVEGTLEAGGDRIADFYFTDGSTQTMRAGQGGTAAVGAEFRPGVALPLSLRGTVGIKYVTTAATDVDIKLTRIPVELVGSYHLGDYRVGAGYVRHMAVRFDGGGVAPDGEFEDAHGPTVEAGWRWVALTYTAMSYVQNGNTYDAGSFGISLTGTFFR